MSARILTPAEKAVLIARLAGAMSIVIQREIANDTRVAIPPRT